MNPYLIVLAVIAYVLIGIPVARLFILTIEKDQDEVPICGSEIIFWLFVVLIWPVSLVIALASNTGRPWFTLRRRSAKKMLTEIKDRRAME